MSLVSTNYASSSSSSGGEEEDRNNRVIKKRKITIFTETCSKNDSSSSDDDERWSKVNEKSSPLKSLSDLLPAPSSTTSTSNSRNSRNSSNSLFEKRQKTNVEEPVEKKSFFNLDTQVHKSTIPTIKSPIKQQMIAPEELLHPSDLYDPANYEMAQTLLPLDDGQEKEEEEEGFQLDKKAVDCLLGRRRRITEDIQVIDVSAADHHRLRERMQLLTPAEIPSDLPEEIRPTTLQKRRHNIKALAFQAKAMEQELEEMWALGRKTKKETQSKYGW